VVGEELWVFIGVVINVQLFQVPDMKDYWSQDFASQVPFFSVIFTRKRFLEIFGVLHLETVPQNENSLRTKTEKVSNFLKYVDGRCRKRFIPSQNISIDVTVVGFKRKIIHYVQS
jgi:hypothetical protein